MAPWLKPRRKVRAGSVPVARGRRLDPAHEIGERLARLVDVRHDLPAGAEVDVKPGGADVVGVRRAQARRR